MMASQGGFQFVSMTLSDDEKASRKKIRSHAAKNPRARKQRVAEFQRTREECEAQISTTGTLLVEHRQCPSSSWMLAQSISKAPTITSQPGLPTADPFQSFSRPLARGEWFLINHFTSRLDLNVAPCPTVPLKDSNDVSQRSMLSLWMQMAAIDAGMLACILLAACRDLSRSSATEELRNLYGNRAAYFSNVAIRSLRESLAQQESRANDGTIIKTMAIGFDSAVSGDYRAVTAHTEALWNMVDLRGGFSELRASGSLAKMCIWALTDHTIGPYSILPLSCIEREFLAGADFAEKAHAISA